MEINIPTIAWAIVNFLILTAILKKFLFGPIVKTLESRAEAVKQNIDSAEADKMAASQLKAEYNTQLQNAQIEAQQIVATAKKAAENTKNEILEEAKISASKVKDKAVKEIEEEKQAAIQQLKGEVSTLSVMLAEKIIGRSLNPEDHKKLVNDFMEEVGELN